MAKDPVCGMEVPEEGAKFMLHFEHMTLYFCSEQCKESFAVESGVKKQATNKGAFARLLERIAKSTENSYGDKPPKCH